MNQASVDRGLFRNTCFRTVREHEVRQGNDEERISMHRAVLGRRTYNYSTLDESTGMVRVGLFVSKDDVLLSKFTQQSSHDGKNQCTLRDSCCAVKQDERAQVTRILIYPTKDDLRAVCIQTAAQRVPEVGDKFSSQHGQKGVCGMILPPEQMPFCLEDGSTPDIVLNPHLLPSRMTVAHLMEMLVGSKACSVAGTLNATPFRDLQVEDVKLAFGRKAFCDGATGKLLDVPVAYGVIYVQRLKHIPFRDHPVSWLLLFVRMPFVINSLLLWHTSVCDHLQTVRINSSVVPRASRAFFLVVQEERKNEKC